MNWKIYDSKETGRQARQGTFFGGTGSTGKPYLCTYLSTEYLEHPIGNGH